jgi:hypothetical protein
MDILKGEVEEERLLSVGCMMGLYYLETGNGLFYKYVQPYNLKILKIFNFSK